MFNGLLPNLSDRSVIRAVLVLVMLAMLIGTAAGGAIVIVLLARQTQRNVESLRVEIAEIKAKMITTEFPVNPPALPPLGSENDPRYQAEVVDNGDGTLKLLPAPAYRRSELELQAEIAADLRRAEEIRARERVLEQGGWTPQAPLAPSVETPKVKQ